MARYIDADKFRKKAFYADTEADINNYIRLYGYADVVPKSEVEALTIELESERGSLNVYKTKHRNAKVEIENLNLEIERLRNILDSYALRYGTVMDKHIVVEKAREDVAREIFEEIDEELNFLKRAYPLNPITRHIIYVFAEFKKKYTESENASGE